MKYQVTKRFFSGLLAGLTIVETTTYPPQVGFRCKKPLGGSGYEIVAVEEIK